MAHTPELRERRVCLFTGASGTLGTAFCRLFRKRYCIAAVYGKRLPAYRLSSSSGTNPIGPEYANWIQALVFKPFLIDDREIRRVVELTRARFGRIDLLVNGAVNVIVPLKLAVRLAHRFWRDRDRDNARVNRNIVNVSSTAGLYVYPNSRQSVCSASKAALNYLICHLADKVRAFGVRVNAIAPNAFRGIVQTWVASCIHRLDQDSVSGQIPIIESGGEALYCPERW